MAISSLTDAEIRRIIGPPTNAFDTHRPLLAEAIIRTSGRILELGMGYGTTPGLNVIAQRTGRQVWSYDDDEEWYGKFKDLQATPNHHVLYTRTFDDAVCEQPWSVALVDHGEVERRVREIGRLAEWAEVVLVHDTEDVRYHYWTIFSLFKYRYDHRARKPWTTAFSNTIEVSQWTI